MGACANKNSAPTARWPARRPRAASRISWSMSATACSSRATRPICHRRRSLPWRSRRAGCRPTIATPSPLKATPTSAAPANTTSRWSAARPVGAHFPRLARHRCLADADHLLRQGTPGRGLQRHLPAVAEPPRRHGLERQLVTVWFRRVPPAPPGRRFCLTAWLLALFDETAGSPRWRARARRQDYSDATTATRSVSATRFRFLASKMSCTSPSFPSPRINQAMMSIS